MAKEQRYYKRKFLNRPGFNSIALLLFEINRYFSKKDGNESLSFDGGMTIGDCSRQITLDFSMGYNYGEDPMGALDNTIGKMRAFRKYVNEFGDEMEKAYAEMVEHEKKKIEEAEKKKRDKKFRKLKAM